MNSRIVSFDVETPNHRNDRICAIGISIIENDHIIDSFSYLVNPECEFDQRNTEIHGISQDMVKESPSFADIWLEVRSLFLENLVVAHNATFDLNVLKKTLLAYDIHESMVLYACTMRMSKKIGIPVNDYKLPTLCEYFGCSLKDHHDAMSDSNACANIFCKLLAYESNVDQHISSFSLGYLNTATTHIIRHISADTSALNELKEILGELVGDNILTSNEIDCLQMWLNEHDHLRGNYPYDKIFQIVTMVLEDGVISQLEQDRLLQLFKNVSDPLRELSHVVDIKSISGKKICLSGDFEKGTKSEITAILLDYGANVLSSVSKKTDMVLVGNKGNSTWVSGNYGTKIKKAMELREQGMDISIIREDDLFSEMEE